VSARKPFQSAGALNSAFAITCAARGAGGVRGEGTPRKTIERECQSARRARARAELGRNACCGTQASTRHTHPHGHRTHTQDARLHPHAPPRYRPFTHTARAFIRHAPHASTRHSPTHTALAPSSDTRPSTRCTQTHTQRAFIPPTQHTHQPTHTTHLHCRLRGPVVGPQLQRAHVVAARRLAAQRGRRVTSWSCHAAAGHWPRKEGYPIDVWWRMARPSGGSRRPPRDGSAMPERCHGAVPHAYLPVALKVERDAVVVLAHEHGVEAALQCTGETGDVRAK
jgi:hypothetical protein